MQDPDENWDERSEPELDRQTNYDAPPRDDGDDSYDYENEEAAVQKALEKISIDIVEIAEGLVADQVADEGGRGFSGDALERKAKEIMATLQGHVDKTVASYATWR